MPLPTFATRYPWSRMDPPARRPQLRSPGGLAAQPTWPQLASFTSPCYSAGVPTCSSIRLEPIPGLRVLGQPLFVLAFASEKLDVYRVMDEMSKKGWSLNGMHRRACVHLAVTLRHAQPGVAERFLSDLRASVEQVRATPGQKGGMAPVYGLAGRMPLRGVVTDLLTRYLDVLGD